MSEIKLLPCPFCGGEAHGFIDKYNKYFTGCSECDFYYGIEIEHDCELEDGWRAIHDSKEEAVDAWNTRKPIDRIVEQFEKCVEWDGYTLDIKRRGVEIIKAGKWIPCSERLPDTRNNILICQKDGYVSVGYYSSKEFMDENSYPYKEVIAWMPLPEPYKESED